MVSTKQGIINTIIGSLISIVSAVIQFLSIYFVLNIYGSQFNGFIRICSSIGLIAGTADGALGIATTLLLVKPIRQNDWFSANEIFSTAKKRYRKNLFAAIFMSCVVAVIYPAYLTITNIIQSDSLNFGNFLVDAGIHTEKNGYVGYFFLLIIILFYCAKNIGEGAIFGVYENVMAADSKGSIKRIVVLFTDALLYGIFFYVINLTSKNAIPLNPLIPFSLLILYSPIRGILIMLYVKRNYVWLKYDKAFDNYKLSVTTSKLSASRMGNMLINNADIVIVSLILGLNVSSILSLYIIIAVNVRVIMSNFITSFREFFIIIAANNGRIYWNSYGKYELYVYIIVAFTFINMSILSPYFVNALYGTTIKAQAQSQQAYWANNEIKVYELIFTSPWFSFLYSAPVCLSMLQEAQMNIIQAKGTVEQITKKQNILGITYLLMSIITMISIKFGLSGDNNLFIALIMMYILKAIFTLIGFVFLWIYVWHYATYNSTMKHVFSNLIVLIVPCILGIIISAALIQNIGVLDLTNNANLKMTPLVELFFASIFISFFIIIALAMITSWKMFIGIIERFPTINKILSISKKNKREERLKKNGIDVDEIVDYSDKIDNLFNYEGLTLDIAKDENEILIGTTNKANVYKIKGKSNK